MNYEEGEQSGVKKTEVTEKEMKKDVEIGRRKEICTAGQRNG